jgi:hypothetical protein
MGWVLDAIKNNFTYLQDTIDLMQDTYEERWGMPAEYLIISEDLYYCLKKELKELGVLEEYRNLKIVMVKDKNCLMELGV